MTDYEIAAFSGGGDDNDLEVRGASAATDIATSRAAQEVQGAIFMAKKFPRNDTKSYTDIMAACGRPTLAEKAQYSYPRGGQMVKGASIHIAREIARCWGNLDSGIVELESTPTETMMLAYAWDLQSNTRSSKCFVVKHERHTKKGVERLSDPRDIRELGANIGARFLRQCILALIPSDIVEAALRKCDDTLRDGGGKPVEDRVREMVVRFKELGVLQEDIEKRLGHKIEATTVTELVNLAKVFTAIKDGVSDVDQWFPREVTVVEGQSRTEQLKAKVKGATAAAVATEPKPQVDLAGEPVQ